MILSPTLRKVALTAHITASVSWLGTIAGFLALAVAGLASQDVQLVRAAYLAMELTAWIAIVPLSVASLLTGVISSLGSQWGLVRHYWVLIKLLINLVATIVLLLYLPTLDALADMAAAMPEFPPDLVGLRDPSPVLHASAALVLLLVATTLSVFKPRGMTRYGQRKQYEQRRRAHRQPAVSQH